MVLDPDLDVRPPVILDRRSGRRHLHLQHSGRVYNTVGVSVDAPAGVLCFYRLSSGSLLHLHTFEQPLYPAFRLPPHSSVCLRSPLGDVTR